MQSPVSESEFRPRPNEVNAVDAPVTTEYFGPDGEPTVEASEFVYAKKTTDTGTYRSRYWILKEINGPGRGTLYDPMKWGATTAPGRLRYRVSQPLYDFSLVSELCFKHYLSFLKTGKSLFLKYAERT